MMTRPHDTKPAWRDEDDAPELTSDFFDRAEVRTGEELVRPAQGTLKKRGRPAAEHPKQQVTLRLDQAVIDGLRRSGPGWQSRVNSALARLLAQGGL